ncbi:MAG: DUF72 domain-containing protein [Bacteroidetes bacterium]|nr:DUF72 domain-containing protein [Bacteroidota bacterium]
MEFGRLEPEELASVDFTLPPDSLQNIAVLKSSPGTDKFELRVGAMKWGRKEWLGNFYPAKTDEKNFLDEYVKHFDSIYFNATFYQVYGPDQILKWKKQASANPNFKFFPKVSQSITHLRRLKNAEELTAQFISGVRAFGEMLGAAQLQVGDNFTPKSFPELKAYVESFPKDFEYFIELRHRDWFTPEWLPKLFDLFSKYNVGFGMTDSPGRRDCVHMQLTIPRTMIRFTASGDDDVDRKRMDAWADRIKDWKNKGLLSAEFFITGPDEKMTPDFIRYFKSRF